MGIIRTKMNRKTTVEWADNPILASGEIGWDTTEDKAKIGDGLTAWSDLEFIVVPSNSGGGFDAEFYIDYSASTVYGAISEDSYTMSCVDPESVEVPYACPAAFTANTVGVLVPAGLYTAYGYFAAYGDNLSNMEYWLGAGTYVDEEPDPPYMQTMEVYNVARNPILNNEGAVSATFRLFVDSIIGVGVGEAWFDTPHDARFKFGILRHSE